MILSRKVRVAGIGEGAAVHEIIAGPQERATLAAAYALRGIPRLEGRFTLRAAADGEIEASLLLNARVEQLCVVSLEPFEATLCELAELRFIPTARLEAMEALSDVNAPLEGGNLDSPDALPYAGDAIDLGAALAEQLALALDPYPRKPGAELQVQAAAASDNPFAALVRHKPEDRG